MSRGPARFRQSDVARALKAAKQAGVNMAVEISKEGTIRMVPTVLVTAKLEGGANPWD